MIVAALAKALAEDAEGVWLEMIAAYETSAREAEIQREEEPDRLSS